jgi:hypothetical protein
MIVDTRPLNSSLRVKGPRFPGRNSGQPFRFAPQFSAGAIESALST